MTHHVDLDLHHVDLDLGPTGIGQVYLDGEEIAKGLRGVTMRAEAGEPVQVDLRLTASTVEVHVEAEKVMWSHPDCEHCRGHEERP